MAWKSTDLVFCPTGDSPRDTQPPVQLYPLTLENRVDDPGSPSTFFGEAVVH